MRIVQKEIGHEKCRAIGPPERQMFERPPADEEPAGCSLDEREIAM
jgi:hypothetical protein